jgi:glutamate racemase
MKKKINNMTKDHLRIVVTDSGLGGLSVQAKLDKKLRNEINPQNVELIYFNSFAGDGLGYNEVSSFDEKIKIFESALSSISNFEPDIILIACNTLSAIYPYTKFAKTNEISVFGIIDLGVELIIESTDNSKESKILLIGTETTINSHQYQNQLISKGVDTRKIFSQGFRYLEDEIQIDYKSEKVESIITKNFNSALQNMSLKSNEELILVLCCTHYGYSENLFRDVVAKKIVNNLIILNPNDKMVEVAADLVPTTNSKLSSVRNEVFSRVKLKEYQIEKLGKLLQKDSIDLARALKNYTYDKNLFTF